MRITDLHLTPVAIRDAPLLNSSGVHEPLALRCVLQLRVDGGADGGTDGAVTGLGECGGDRPLLDALATLRPHLVGRSVFDTTALGLLVEELFAHLPAPARRSVAAAVEVACLDAQGRLLGRPVCDLLGGRVRDAVPYAAYLFYKWAEHPALDGRPAIADDWGPALDPDGVVAQARRMVDAYGFGSIKLKGGVFPPAQEAAAVHALRAAFPDHPLRIDPNAAWTVGTARRVAAELAGVLEYLEDPTPGVAGMAAVARDAGVPLATNMCVVDVEGIAPAVAAGAVQVVLADHHYWGGLRATCELGATCRALGLGLSMHSNSHLGISLAAMTHVAAATPHLTHACDTHYPWTAHDDVVAPGALAFRDGAVAVPEGPGLGVELDPDRLAERHAAYVESGRQVRDDAGYMRRVDPSFDPSLPRW
jgi:glucarate dehydratase